MQRFVREVAFAAFPLDTQGGAVSFGLKPNSPATDSQLRFSKPEFAAGRLPTGQQPPVGIYPQAGRAAGGRAGLVRLALGKQEQIQDPCDGPQQQGAEQTQVPVVVSAEVPVLSEEFEQVFHG